MADINYEIIEELGILSSTASGWQKELNFISWNEGEPKYDIRMWSPDHQRMGKGISLSYAEAQALLKILKNMLPDQ